MQGDAGFEPHDPCIAGFAVTALQQPNSACPAHRVSYMSQMLSSFERRQLMKTVENWRWMTWNLSGTKMTSTRYHMDEETALARPPEAVKVPGSMVLRQVCETEADSLKVMNTKPR